ncbi:MAG: hypothetical protein JXB10_04130 [Pirellulales bacterium]|nr:hypothetical protein [Pirellulales bacterium]
MNAFLSCLRLASAALLVAAGSGSAVGSSPWKPPPNPLHLDFRADAPQRRVLLSEDGQGWQITLEFQMIRYTDVSLTADLPDPGRFQIVQENPRSLVDVRDVRGEGTLGAARLVGRIKEMSLADAETRAQEDIKKIGEPLYQKYFEESKSLRAGQLRAYLREHELPPPRDRQNEKEELRKMYAWDRTLDELAPDLRRELAKAAERKPQWVTSKDKARWEKAKSRSLLKDYLILREHEIIEEYLKQCGLGGKTDNFNFRTKLDAQLAAVHLIVSGQVCEGPGEFSSALKALSPQDVNTLRGALSVRLRCRYYPEVDPEDPNAQWFQGQRVACRARGVAAIRLEGKLAPGAHDRVDWWILEDYSPDGVILEAAKQGTFRIDPPLTGKWGTALRVVATGEEATDYAVEIRPVKKTRDRRKIVIHEIPNIETPKFPY